jgi:phospholipid-binding lipoprotein MlaA
LSITNIIAASMLAGSLQCPPPLDPSVKVQAPLVQAQVAAPPPPPIPLPTPVAAADATMVVADATPPAADLEPTATASAEAVVADAQPATDQAAVASGDDTIVVTAQSGPPPGDPVEAINEVSFIAVQAVDSALIAPVAHGYMKGVPVPIQDGLHNFLNNLDEPIVFVNFLLQLKIGKALETVGRFAVNSTIGAGGLFDVAKKKPFNLPRRSNGLADTLGFYGVGPGPYLFLPLIGSTSLRDIFGRVADLSLLPTAVGKPFTQPLVSLTKGALSSLDDRVENDEILTRVQQSDNPYAAMREYYLTKRQAEIDVLKGKRCNADIDLDELQLLKLSDKPKTGPASAPAAQPVLQPAQ